MFAVVVVVVVVVAAAAFRRSPSRWITRKRLIVADACDVVVAALSCGFLVAHAEMAVPPETLFVAAFLPMLANEWTKATATVVNRRSPIADALIVAAYARMLVGYGLTKLPPLLSMPPSVKRC